MTSQQTHDRQTLKMASGDDQGAGGATAPPPQDRKLPDCAKRALAEAEERRKQSVMAANRPDGGPKELHGPKGAEPTRYGDWERKGIAYDF